MIRLTKKGGSNPLADPLGFGFTVFEKLTGVKRENVVVSFDSWRAKKRLNGRPSKGLFIDGGSNLGQGFQFFSEYYSTDRFDFELFEPNPHCIVELEKLIQGSGNGSVVLNPKALSTDNGIIRFYGTDDSEGGAFAKGGSTNPDHNAVFYEASAERAIEVEAMDFCVFLEDKAKDYDLIVLKLDIEGAENNLLEKMIERGSIDAVSYLYVEFHSQYLKEPLRAAEQARERKIIEQLSSKDLKLRIWR